MHCSHQTFHNAKIFQYHFINVGLGDRSYPILIGTDLGSEIERISAEYLHQGKKVVSIVDRGLTEAAPSFAKDFLDSVPTLSLPAGETTKSIKAISMIVSGQAVFISEYTVHHYEIGIDEVGCAQVLMYKDFIKHDR